MTVKAEDFCSIDCVVRDDLRFRLKLGIGEDAYRTIRYGKKLQQLWDVGGVAASGAAVAASPTVAGTFFGGSSLLSLIGFGAAVTPIGWVIAAGVGSAGAYFGVMRLVGNYGGSRVKRVPEFINTPVDFLGMTLVDMMGTVAIKLAAVDGHIHPKELETITDSFVDDWGIDREYAETAIGVIAENEGRTSLRDAARGLGGFLRENPDCHPAVIKNDYLSILRDLIHADGVLDEREELALEKVTELLDAECSVARSAGSTARNLADNAQATVVSAVGKLATLAQGGAVKK